MYNHICSETIGEGVINSMKALNQYGVMSIRENQNKQEEVKEIQLTLDVLNPSLEPMVCKAMPCSLKQLSEYIDEFLDGTADNAGWKYTYHGLYSPFYEKVIAELKRNIHTRRACIALGQGDINFTADPPCLQLLMFNVVAGKLEITAVFRSNDGVKAFPMNIQAIAALQRKIADEIELQTGELHYIANNFHAYNKDIVLLEQYCRNFDTKSKDKLFYSYMQLKNVTKSIKQQLSKS